MIKKGLISAVLAMTCLVTACGSQTAAPQNEAKQTANVQQNVGEQPPQEASDTAVTEQASEALRNRLRTELLRIRQPLPEMHKPACMKMSGAGMYCMSRNCSPLNRKKMM